MKEQMKKSQDFYFKVIVSDTVCLQVNFGVELMAPVQDTRREGVVHRGM